MDVSTEIGEQKCGAHSTGEARIIVEQTLALIKPDLVDKSFEIEDIILKAGFTILKKRLVTMTPEQASEFYEQHIDNLYFESLLGYMSNKPVVVLHLARENAVGYWRALLGPANPKKARLVFPDSLRALYGIDLCRNGLHGSQNSALAAREIRFFFPDDIVEPVLTGENACDYIARYVNPTLLRGLSELCKLKPVDPMRWLADWLLENNPNKAKARDICGNVVISTSS